MGSFFRILTTALVALVVSVSGVLAVARADVDLQVDPRGSFLRACTNDTVQSPVVVDLASLSLSPGQFVRLQSRGHASVGLVSPFSSDLYNKGMIATFSSSNTLLDATNLDRIPGAIDAGVDIITPDGCADGGGTPIATDVPHDFFIAGVDSEQMPGGVTYTDVVIPSGALYLFVCMFDSYYSDNADANNDFIVRIISSPCQADFNNSGTVTVQDLFDFLGAWFARLPGADVNGSGMVTVQDLFDFLALWFARC